MKRIIYLLVLSIWGGVHVQAQEKPSQTEDLLNLSLEELMNVEIVSASKKAENLFDAPSSASVLTKDEIKKSGATSIPEALRLIPGLIVREQSNGNYDIHVRGLDNVPPNSILVNSASTTTLVMVDNRPVYNYLQGGTFWETLPVDLNDVERIEVVRGPVSAMYGPNAVSGVIHIITRKPQKNGMYTIANAQYGTPATTIANASVGYQPNGKFNAIVSGNFQQRDRHEISYYRVDPNDFVDTPDSIGVPNPAERYPHPERSMNKYGLNAFIHYHPTKKIGLSLTAGLQDSDVQNSYYENLVTPLSTFLSGTRYADVKVNAYGFSGQVSYLRGTQNPTLGSIGGKYDFNTLDAAIEYSWSVKGLTVKPGLMYRKALYDDTRYWDASIQEGVISGRREIVTHAASLRTEYVLLATKLRLIGNIRADKFNYPDKYYLSYQLAANYKLHEKHLFRLGYARANRSPFVYDTYLNFTIPGTVRIAPEIVVPTETNVYGNKKLSLVTSDMLEAGYRAKMADNLQVDVDVFRSWTRNYSDFIVEATEITPGSPIATNVVIQNLPLTVRQTGVTASVNYVINQFQIKPFVTVQETKLNDYSSYYNTADAQPTPANPEPVKNNVNSGIGTSIRHTGTPTVFGGMYLSYQIHPKFTINVNPYYYSAQTFYHRDNLNYRDGIRGVDQMASKLIVNARIAYKPVKQLDIFVSGKNMLNQTTREFYRSDRMGAAYLVGINFEL